MKNITYSCFKWIFTSLVCILLSSCNDFLSSIKNENTQEISTLLYKLDDIDVCMNGAYGAFCSSSYYDYIKFAELVGSDCSTSTLNSSILPSFDVVSRENNFYKHVTDRNTLSHLKNHKLNFYSSNCLPSGGHTLPVKCNK